MLGREPNATPHLGEARRQHPPYRPSTCPSIDSTDRTERPTILVTAHTRRNPPISHQQGSVFPRFLKKNKPDDRLRRFPSDFFRKKCCFLPALPCSLVEQRAALLIHSVDCPALAGFAARRLGDSAAWRPVGSSALRPSGRAARREVGLRWNAQSHHQAKPGLALGCG